MLKIRRYVKSDQEQVWDLHILAMRHVGAYKGDGPWDDDLRDIEGVYLLHQGEFLVGEDNGRILAMGAFKKSGNNMAEIKRMRVHPDWQGRGYGKLIYDELEKRAQELGYDGFHLETSELQIGAQRLYLKCGFEEVGRTVIDGFKCILFEKRFSR